MADPLERPESFWLGERARRDPAAPAVRFAGEELSFAALEARTEAIAARLASRGVGPGDRIAVALESSLRFVEIVHAVQRLGATLVPVNTRLTAVEAAALFEDASPRLVLYGAALEPMVAGVRFPKVEAREELDALDPVRATALPGANRDPAAPHSILYTSGTSGRPKGAMLTLANHFASASASRRNLGAARGDRWLLAMPLHHVGGLSILLRSVIDGIPVELHRGFVPREVDRALREDGVTLASMVPTMLLRFFEHGRPAWPSLRVLLLGGGPASPDLVRRAAEAGVPVAPTYGLTEAASQVATMPLAEAPRLPQASGRPLAGTEIRIAGPGPDGTGEILVRGPTVMSGYIGRPDATREALRGGWLHTGDLGRVDGEGFLHVAARRGDLIVSGGENVYPAEVEAALLAHPGVAEAAVFPDPDLRWGQRVAAAVVLRGVAGVGAAELEAWCARRLARFKLPRSIVFVDSLPRAASGKLQRHRLAGTASREPDPSSS